MIGHKLSHYYPEASWAWPSEAIYATLQWFGPGAKPTEAEIAALPWPPAPTVAELIDAVDAHVEGVAQSMSYKSAAHCAGYVSSTIPQWAAEAQAFVAWRDQVWLTAYSLDPENLPATVADALALLPVFVRPEL